MPNIFLLTLILFFIFIYYKLVKFSYISGIGIPGTGIPTFNNNNVIKHPDNFNRYDYALNPLYPPEKQYEPEHNYLNYTLPSLTTSGYNYNYQLYGYLYRDLDKKVIQLYGRRRTSNIYDYYGNTKDSSGLEFKTPIDSKHKELIDGDLIEVQPFGSEKFKVIINSNVMDPFLYIPY